MLNCTNYGNFGQEVQIMFIDIIMTFQMNINGQSHSVVVTFDRPIQGKFDGIFTANNRLAIMERSVYVYAKADDLMAFSLENISRDANRFFTRFMAKNRITGELFTLQAQLDGFHALRVQYLY